MHVVWWLAAIISSLAYAGLLIPTTNALNYLFRVDSQPYDFGLLPQGMILSFVLASLINMLLAGGQGVRAFLLLCIICGIASYFFLFSPLPMLSY